MLSLQIQKFVSWCLKILTERNQYVEYVNVPKTAVWNIIKHYREARNILDNKDKIRGHPKLVADDKNKITLVKLDDTLPVTTSS